MNKILKWIKEHIRPHVKYRAPKDDIDSKDKDFEDRIEDAKDNTEVGIKFKFKF